MGKKYNTFKDIILNKWGLLSRNKSDVQVGRLSIYRDYYFRLYKKMVTAMFTWENLPNGISQRFIEDKLFNNGFVIFYKSKTGALVVSEATQNELNHYEEPISYQINSLNSVLTGEIVQANKCVAIWNNLFCSGNIATCYFFANRLAGILSTFDTNLEQLKNPYVISCPESQKITAQQMFKQKEEGVPYIFTSDDINNMVKINLLDTNVKNHTKDLEDIVHAVESDALTAFGIDSINVFKRERLTQGESNQNNEQIQLNRYSMQTAREKACEEINSMFGTNISVKVSEAFTPIKEGNSNGVE